MVRGYLRSECVKELLSQAQDSSLTHSTLQLRATMSAIRHPCLIMGQCPSNFEGRNILAGRIPAIFVPFSIQIYVSNLSVDRLKITYKQSIMANTPLTHFFQEEILPEMHDFRQPTFMPSTE